MQEYYLDNRPSVRNSHFRISEVPDSEVLKYIPGDTIMYEDNRVVRRTEPTDVYDAMAEAVDNGDITSESFAEHNGGNSENSRTFAAKTLKKLGTREFLDKYLSLRITDAPIEVQQKLYDRPTEILHELTNYLDDGVISPKLEKYIKSNKNSIIKDILEPYGKHQDRLIEEQLQKMIENKQVKRKNC